VAADVLWARPARVQVRAGFQAVQQSRFNPEGWPPRTPNRAEPSASASAAAPAAQSL